MSYNNCKIGFVGAGKMATAIMGGIIKSKFFCAENIYTTDPNNGALEAAKIDLGVNIATSIKELLDNVDIVLIATKPFVINEVLADLKGLCDDKLVISILAGVKIEKIEEALTGARVIRVMPNTPAFVNEAMCALCKGKLASEDDLTFVERMVSSIGQTVRIEEKDIDIVTALSGSGPAFYYYIIDLMAHSAKKLGLDYKTCLKLSAQTALGSAKMMLERDQTPEELITAVTTPGGCTAVGNSVLVHSDIKEILDKTIKETMEKAKALG